MNLEDLNKEQQLEHSFMAVHCVVTAILTRYLANSAEVDQESQAIMDLALRLVAKYDFIAEDIDPDAEVAARSFMEAIVTQTISGAQRHAKAE